MAAYYELGRAPKMTQVSTSTLWQKKNSVLCSPAGAGGVGDGGEGGGGGGGEGVGEGGGFTDVGEGSDETGRT